MGTPSLTLWGHDQSKLLFVLPCHSHVMRQPTKEQQKMQKVMLIGNLGRDPEVKYSQQGTAIAQFSVATTERWKDKGGEPQEHTEWFAVKAFGRRAEVVGEHLCKGSHIYVEGRKRTESWDDKQTGAKHYRISSMSTGSSSWIRRAADLRRLRAAPTTRQQ